MSADRIHLSKADISPVEEEFVIDALRSGWVAPLGPDVDAFEREIAARTGVAHALALSSGTAALHLALIHLGARPGTAVLCASMTFAATANAIAYTGADPVFVDSQDSDGNVDPHLMLEAVDQLRSEGMEVVAACPVDLFGRICNYDLLEPGLATRGVPMLVDAAESLGSSFHGRAAGSFGQAATLSFNGNKILTTSGGGMLLSNDAELLAHCRKLSTQAREPVPWYEHTEIGFNYRLSNILAALGRGQLTRLDEMVERRRRIRAQYVNALSDVEGIRFLTQTSDTDRIDNCWLTSLIIDRPGITADHVVSAMSAQGIEARHLWKPMHLQPVFSETKVFGGKVSENLFRKGVTLPSGSALTPVQIERVIEGLMRSLS